MHLTAQRTRSTKVHWIPCRAATLVSPLVSSFVCVSSIFKDTTFGMSLNLVDTPVKEAPEGPSDGARHLHASSQVMQPKVVSNSALDQ